MRIIIALCSMILLFSFTGIQAQTESVPVAGDSIQAPAPAVEPPVVTESPAVKAAPELPGIGSLRNSGLTGTVLFSCQGFYYYNKSVATYTHYDYYGNEEEIEYGTRKTYMYAILVNGNYFVTDGLSIGGTLGVLTISSKLESYDQNIHYSFFGPANTSFNLIGPRLAYYYGKKDSKVIPFAAFEYDLITADNYNDTAMRIGAGVLLQPKPHFGISFGLDYLKFGEEETSTNIIGVLGLTGIIY